MAIAPYRQMLRPLSYGKFSWLAVPRARSGPNSLDACWPAGASLLTGCALRRITRSLGSRPVISCRQGTLPVPSGPGLWRYTSGRTRERTTATGQRSGGTCTRERCCKMWRLRCGAGAGVTFWRRLLPWMIVMSREHSLIPTRRVGTRGGSVASKIDRHCAAPAGKKQPILPDRSNGGWKPRAISQRRRCRTLADLRPAENFDTCSTRPPAKAR